MKCTRFPFFLSGLPALLILSNVLFAGETLHSEKKPELAAERVEVNSKALSSELMAMMQEKRALELQENHQESAKKPFHLVSKARTASRFVSPYSIHQVVAFSVTGDLVEIEDGSRWSVSLSDISTVIQWRIGDRLSLTPSYGIFSNSYYYLVNHTLNSSVRVLPFEGPLAMGGNTHWVYNLDSFLGVVTLVNGRGEYTRWCISESDAYLFHTWGVNDAIIIGNNSGFPLYLSSYDHILINVNMNHYVRCYQF